MTDKQKAIELSIKVMEDGHFESNGVCQRKQIANALMDMAEWKEQEIIKKACEWLKDTLMSDEGGFPITSNGVKEFIKDFKKAMEE